MEYKVGLSYCAYLEEGETVIYHLTRETNTCLMEVNCKGEWVKQEVPIYQNVPKEFLKDAYDMIAARIYYDNTTRKEMEAICSEYFPDAQG